MGNCGSDCAPEALGTSNATAITAAANSQSSRALGAEPRLLSMDDIFILPHESGTSPASDVVPTQGTVQSTQGAATRTEKRLEAVRTGRHFPTRLPAPCKQPPRHPSPAA